MSWNLSGLLSTDKAFEDVVSETKEAPLEVVTLLQAIAKMCANLPDGEFEYSTNGHLSLYKADDPHTNNGSLEIKISMRVGQPK